LNSNKNIKYKIENRKGGEDLPEQATTAQEQPKRSPAPPYAIPALPTIPICYKKKKGVLFLQMVDNAMEILCHVLIDDKDDPRRKHCHRPWRITLESAASQSTKIRARNATDIANISSPSPVRK
jgi:hypothetical protein